ncbi:hypothetical protein BJ165DRAFT_562111 [Panaeolus papilionaceus]|nr:hypothetical protein BJ165DRAFT_562111 [Panaeolus papilionaceus]
MGSPHQDVLLPNEIWADIFSRVCLLSARDQANQQFTVYERISARIKVHTQKSYLAPFTLSHVCRRWNSLATALTSLWTHIFVYRETQAPDLLLEVWLARSGTKTLSIWVDAHETGRSRHDREFGKCLVALRAVAHRWRAITFALASESAFSEWDKVFGKGNEAEDEVESDEDDDEDDVQLRRLEFPVLETLEAGFYRWDGEAEEAFVSRILSTAPNLRTLRIGDRYYGDKNLHSLTHLLEKSPNIIDFSLTGQYLVFLDRDIPYLRHLESLRLHNCTSAVLSNNSPERYVLPNLRKLTISGFDNPTDVALFFKGVSLPALKDLTMTPSLHRPSFRKMAIASQCEIEKLCIKDREPVDAYMVQFLASPPFHNLVDLTLISDEISNEIVMFLDGSERGFHTSSGVVRTPVFAGTLAYLTLIGCSSDDGYLGALAASRVKNGVLRHLYVEVVYGLSEHGGDVAEFAKLKREGYDVDLRGMKKLGRVSF